MKNDKQYLAVLLMTAGLLLPSRLEGSDMKITNYYPALYGEYERIRLMPRSISSPAPDPSCVIGTLYSNPNGILKYCYNDGTNHGLWGNIPEIWTQNLDNIYLTDTPANPNLRVGIGTSTPAFKLTLQVDTTIIAKGKYGSGATLPNLGAGSRLIWYPRKAAFRAGYVDGTQWDHTNIGNFSVAMGKNTTASGSYAVVGGGDNNTASGNYASIIGGQNNNASKNYSAIGGGQNNKASGYYAMIYGGQDNEAATYYALVIGGRANQAAAYAAVVGGGEQNTASTSYSLIGGGSHNLVDRIADGTSAVGYAVIGGGANNKARHDYTVVLGGDNNTVMGPYSTISGGGNNTIGDPGGLIGKYSAISGGQDNTVTGNYSSISGGRSNLTSADYTVISGGLLNKAIAAYSVVGGGERNKASGLYAMIMGGTDNSVAGDYSWAGGRNVQLTANADHTFAWGYSDDPLLPVSINTPNAFIIAPGRIAGEDWNPKVGIRDAAPAAALEINANGTLDDYLTIFDGNTNVLTIKNNGLSSAYIGVFKPVPGDPTHAMQFGNANDAYLSGGGQWTNGSSRTFKENIHPLSSQDAEKALDGLNPVTFHYKVTPDQQYVGFIAEDVPALVAMNDRASLNTLDIIAVLTKAVQDQEQRIKKQDERMEKIQNQIRQLKNMLGE